MIETKAKVEPITGTVNPVIVTVKIADRISVVAIIVIDAICPVITIAPIMFSLTTTLITNRTPMRA